MIVDQYGKQIRSNRPITEEIASVERDPLVLDYMGKVKLNPDKTLRTEGSRSIELYEDLLRDSKVGSTLQTRRLAVTGKEWQVEPASDKRDDVKRADYVSDALKAISLDATRRAALSGLITGFKSCEIMWEYSEGDVYISRIIPRACRRFTFGLKDELRLLTKDNMVEGEELPARKFQTFTNPSDNGSPYGDGIGRMLYWPVWFKKNGVKFWAVFLDKFASPTVVGKYPVGTTTADQNKLLEAIEAIQQEAAIKIPETMLVEFLEAARAGTVTYETFIQYWDGQIAQVLLGHTGSSESTPGKLGSEDAAKDVREDYIKSDADLLCESENNQMIRWITDYNFPNVSRNGYPKVWIRTEPEKDLVALAERDKIILVDMGMGKRVPESYIEDTYGIPLAKEGEAVIGVPAPVNPFDQISPDPSLLKRGINPTLEKGGEGGFAGCSCGRHHNFVEDSLVQKYMAALGPSLKTSKANALRDIESWLRSQSTPPGEEEFISRVQSILGEAYIFDEAAIADTVAEVYTAQKIAGVITRFGGPDIRAMNFLSNLDNFYISKFIQNPDSVATIKAFLNEQYLQNGAGLFGRTADESIQAFRDLFGQKLSGLEDYQIRRIADTAVQRTRNWSDISQMHGAGIPEISILAPPTSCDFCKEMEKKGKAINVNVAYNQMTKLAGMMPEEYEEHLKNRANAPISGNVEALVAAGALPPYHPHCRCSVIKRVR